MFFTRPIQGWEWIPALIGGLVIFVMFSAGFSIWTYLRPAKITSGITPRDAGLAYEELTFVTADRLKLAAWYLPSVNQSKSAILLLHGYPADKGDILPATAFLQKAYNLLYLDFRYFGKSEGKYSTIGVKETQDVLAAVNYLKSRGMEKIGTWGFSMGAAAALMTLPQANEINAVVSDTSYANLELMAREVFRQVPGLNRLIAGLMRQAVKVILKIDIREQSPLKSVAETQIPILFIHSRSDDVIPFRQAELLKAASSRNPQGQFWFRDEGMHGELGGEEYQNKVRNFFGKHL